MARWHIFPRRGNIDALGGVANQEYNYNQSIMMPYPAHPQRSRVAFAIPSIRISDCAVFRSCIALLNLGSSPGTNCYSKGCSSLHNHVGQCGWLPPRVNPPFRPLLTIRPLVLAHSPLFDQAVPFLHAEAWIKLAREMGLPSAGTYDNPARTGQMVAQQRVMIPAARATEWPCLKVPDIPVSHLIAAAGQGDM
jgi:hypothetical protein